MAYRICFAESVKRQLRQLEARQRALLLDTIEQQLSHEPTVETRNRKLLRPNPLAPWELRVGDLGDLRVFYDVETQAKEVRVLAVGQKKGNSVWIDDEEVQL